MQDRNSITSLLVSLLLISGVALGQTAGTNTEVDFAKHNLGGPRLGVTVVAANTTIGEQLKENNMGLTLSQFGWHFEHKISPQGYGPSFVVQFVPLVAGVEYGKLLFHGTLAMGIRMPNGIEFGLGPNLMVAPVENHTSLVLAVGKSFDFSGVQIPVNFTAATNPDGNRFSIMFGYSIDRSAKR